MRFSLRADSIENVRRNIDCDDKTFNYQTLSCGHVDFD